MTAVFPASRAARPFALALALACAAPTGARAEVALADTAAGVDLNSYSDSSASVAGGVSISAPMFTTALTGSLAAWVLTNRGAISGLFANGVVLPVAGSGVINSGTITTTSSGNAVVLAGGGSVSNEAGGTISAVNAAISIGTTSAGAGSVTNAGTITQTGTAGDLVTLRFGGKVTNLAGGTITASNSSNAVSVGQGASREVENWGTITNSYTGGGYPAGVLMQGGASTLTNHPGALISGTLNGVYTSSSAFLTLVNDGTIRSTGTSASARAAELAGGGDVTNSGTIASAAGDGLYLGRAGTVVNTGTISGAVRAISFAGNYARTLTLGTGSVLNGLVQGGTGTDALVLQGTGSEDISKFLSFETLAMQGTDWTLTGAGGLAISGSVTAGRLSVEGTLTLPQIEAAGGTLAVSGTVAGTVRAGAAGRVEGAGTLGALAAGAGGTVSPGSGTGTATLTVTGPAGFAAGSVLQVDADAAGGSDLLAVGGVAVLDGGTVAVRAAAGNYAPETDYVILSAGGGVSGAFGDVTSSLAFLTPTLSYSDTEVLLRLTRNGLDFGSVGGTFNQRSAGAAVEAAGAGNAVYDAALMLDADAARAAFDQVSGEIHASLKTALIGDSRLPRETALARLRGPGAAGVTGWGLIYGSNGRRDGDGNAAGFRQSSAGIIGGVEITLDSGARLGAMAGAGRASLEISGRASSADTDTATLAVYGGQSWGALSLRGGLSLARHDTDTLRAPSFDGYSGRLAASYGGRTTQGFAELAYAFEAGGWQLEPFVSLAAIRLQSDGFSESGGDGALSAAPASQSATVATLGLHYATSFDPGHKGKKARLSGLIGWQQVSGRGPEAALAFAGDPAFAVRGVPAGRGAAVVEIGLAVDLAPQTVLTLSYTGLHGEGGSDGRLGLSVTAQF
jgi:outer membrane autotransporter protein